MSENWRVRYAIVCLLVFVGFGSALPSYSQSNQKVKITGTIYEYDANNKRVPLGFATVSIPDAALGTTSNDRGKYELPNVPVGKVRLSIQYLGKVSIDTLVNATKDLTLNFTLKNEDFRLNEVTVTATNSRSGKSTASKISRAAMDHMQATSLSDLMALLPGGLSQNQNLSNSQKITIRQLSSGNSNDDANLNSLGTAIIRDGAPISNNANLSAANPTVAGSGAAMAGGASPVSGADVRSISTENIESVEVIRGIPSVEYGDLTSGAVIIHSKAGREPLRVKAKANPNIYQVSMGTGFELGGNKGALNVSADYAYNTSNITASYRHYERASAKLLYSNTFFNNNLRSNTSFDFIYGKDESEPNPDDQQQQKVNKGLDVGFTLNTNGTWNINKGWLQNVRYVLSGTYTDKDYHHEQLWGNATAPFSMTTVDGAVLSNIAGKRVYDVEGNEITNFTGEDVMNHAIYLPNSYVENYDIDSREVNIFAKLSANLFKQSGNVSNRILLGVDFKSDGNVGKGKTFDPTLPPYKNNSYYNATYRSRSYKDIPFINQFGAFVEENFKWSLFGSNDLNIQAGVRFDHTSVVGGTVSPRINASLEFIPNTLTLFGGYGITAKMPTLLYLYPENAYFEYINLNEMTSSSIPEDERLFITTTRVFEVDNSDLKIAKNYKAEVGFNLKLGKMQLNFTGFHERLKDGYMMGTTLDTYKSVDWTTYKRDKNQNNELVGTTNQVLSYYNKPTNNLNIETTGVEFDLNLGRIDAIRTAFQLNGAWMRSKSWNEGYKFYTNDGEAATARKNVAIYDKKAETTYREQFSTTLRAIHNIPRIGLVVTMTAQAVWQEANWSTYGNDSIPLGYIALDGTTNWFEANQFNSVDELKASEYNYMWRTVSHSKAIKQTYNPYFCFNLNVTKEISDMLRVSFFANNMFRSYPRMKDQRELGSYTTVNNRFFFGLELSLTL